MTAPVPPDLQRGLRVRVPGGTDAPPAIVSGVGTVS